MLAAGMALPGCGSGTAVVPNEEPGPPGSPRSAVAIARAETYDRSLIRAQVETMFDSIGGLGDVLAHGNRVAIKTNLTGGMFSGSLPGIPETESFLTHPEVVRATAELLRDAGAREIYIVEAVYEPESWPYFGYQDIARDIGATLVDLNYADPYPDFIKASPGTQPFVYDEFTFHPILIEVDAFVSVAKMKCHSTAGVTLTMKNLFGLVPYRFYETLAGDGYRTAFHGSGEETRQRLPRIILDLNMARPVTLSLIDGVLTTEAGEGPWIQTMGPIRPGVLVAGKDPVATDAVATAAMGFDPTSDFPVAPYLHADNHLDIAARLGLGTNKPEEIEIVGARLEDVTIPFTPCG